MNNNHIIEETLLELTQGKNREAAQDEIKNRVYRYATLFRMVSMVLHRKYGFEDHHTLFDSEKEEL